MDLEFQSVLGLGSFCSVKFNINMFFSNHKYGAVSKEGTSSLFDWLFIYDYNRLADAFSNNFSDLFDEKYIYIARDGHTIENGKYNMSWNHIYKGLFPHKIPVTQEQFLEDLPVIKEKINYQIQKFLSCNNSRTLYIVDSKYAMKVTKEILENLYNSITKFRNNNNFMILWLFNDHHLIDFELDGYIFKKISNVNIFTENHNEWDTILREFKFNEKLFY